MSGINQFQKPQSPIEGILKGLQAVESVYGISTKAAQQKLIESQLKGEDISQKKAQLELEGEQSVAAGKPNTYALSKMGYIPSSGYGNDAQGETQAPQAGAQLTPNDFRAPKNFTPISQGDESPLMQSIVPKQPAASPQAGQSTLGTFVDQNGKKWLNFKILEDQQKYAKGGLDIKKTKGEIAKQPAELQGVLLENATKAHKLGTEDIEKATEKFNASAQPLLDKITFHNMINDAFASGNPVAIKHAALATSMGFEGIKRANIAMPEDLSDPTFGAALKAAGAEARTGKLGAEELKNFVETNNTALKALDTHYNKIASDMASQHVSKFGGAKANVLNTLSPSGSGANILDTKVLPSKKTGFNELHIKNAAGWSPIGESASPENTYSGEDIANKKIPSNTTQQFIHDLADMTAGGAAKAIAIPGAIARRLKGFVGVGGQE